MLLLLLLFCKVKKPSWLFSVPEPYLIFGNRYYVRRMNIDGSNLTQIPQLHSFVHIIDLDDKVNHGLRLITNFLLLARYVPNVAKRNT